MVVMDDVPWIYGAAAAATCSESVAREVTERVVRGAGSGATRGALRAEAVRLAVRTAPAAPFVGLDPDDAEALALVRLTGAGVRDVAAVTGEDQAAVSRRLTRALRTLSRPRLVA